MEGGGEIERDEEKFGKEGGGSNPLYSFTIASIWEDVVGVQTGPPAVKH